jgi:tetratricopeptide (TPR) repeat protein
MKSRHRHELKTNELAEWLGNLPQWAKENRITIIGALVLIVAVGGLYFWKVYARNLASVRIHHRFTSLINQLSLSKDQVLRAHARGSDLSFILIQPGGPAENLKTFADNTNDRQMAALALIKRAEAIRAELHYRLGTVAKQDLVAQINRAKLSYTEAIQKAPSNPSLIGAATFGLGLCEEELGNFDQAAKIYRDITASPDFEGTVAKTAAEHRLETMADYKGKVVFKPSPKPKPLISSDVVDLQLPTEANLPTKTNLPTDSNLLIDVNLAPQAPNSIPAAPDTNLELQTPNSVSDIAETNQPGK